MTRPCPLLPALLAEASPDLLRSLEQRTRITYDERADLLYIRFDEKRQDVENLRVAEDIVLDVGAGGKLVGIEILSATEHLDLASLLPGAWGREGVQPSRPNEAHA